MESFFYLHVVESNVNLSNFADFSSRTFNSLCVCVEGLSRETPSCVRFPFTERRGPRECFRLSEHRDSSLSVCCAVCPNVFGDLGPFILREVILYEVCCIARHTACTFPKVKVRPTMASSPVNSRSSPGVLGKHRDDKTVWLRPTLTSVRHRE